MPSVKKVRAMPVYNGYRFKMDTALLKGGGAGALAKRYAQRLPRRRPAIFSCRSSISASTFARVSAGLSGAGLSFAGFMPASRAGGAFSAFFTLSCSVPAPPASPNALKKSKRVNLSVLMLSFYQIFIKCNLFLID